MNMGIVLPNRFLIKTVSLPGDGKGWQDVLQSTISKEESSKRQIMGQTVICVLIKKDMPDCFLHTMIAGM